MKNSGDAMQTLNSFNFYSPVRIIFGRGKISEIGKITKDYGKKILLVTGQWRGDNRQKLYEKVRSFLEKEGLSVTVFNGSVPNPTVNEVEKGREVSRKAGSEVIVGIGGGSAMDVAKAIAVAHTHPGPIWNYVYFQKTQPTSKTLPVILAPTTSGTGSHVNKCSVVTNPENHLKVGIVNDNLFARTAIIDPELMLSVPKKVTASTGFDVFTHAFESYISKLSNPLVDGIALEAIRIVAEYLPRLIRGLSHDLRSKARRIGTVPGDRWSDAIYFRSMMAIADTFAGISIANVGTTLPHSMAQPISGYFPNVSHGIALAIVYPPLMDFSWQSSVKKFATVARIFNPDLCSKGDREAAQQSGPVLADFLKKIGLYLRLKDAGISRDAIPSFTKDALDFPDTGFHPCLASKKDIVRMYSGLL